MVEWLIFTFALTGRREWGHGTQGVALGYGLAGLSARAGPHNRLLRRQHCSSLCSQSEGHEPGANMASALGHDFVGFLAVYSRHNIRGPHFASKVSYSAGAATFAECSRSASCCYVATLFDQKYCRISLNISTMKSQKETPPVSV